MSPDRPIPRSLVVLGTALLLTGLLWLVFGVGERRMGMALLPERDEQGDLQPGGARIGVFAAAPAFSVDEAMALPEAAWRAWTGPGYIEVPHGQVAWVRVTLRNRGAVLQQGVLADTSYFTDRVDAWWRDQDGRLRQAKAGLTVPGRDKALWGRTAAFQLQLPPGGERTVWLRVSDYNIAHLQPVWWERESDYFAALVRGVFTECICYGVLCALVLYNLVLWARLRYVDMGFYVLSASAGTAFNIIANGGLALMGVALGSPGHEMLIAAAFGLSAVGMLGFARAFLGTAEMLPQLDRVLRGWRWVLAAVLVGVLAMPWMFRPVWLGTTTLAVVVNDALCMLSAVLAWRRGAVHARFFIFAFMLLLVAALPALYSVATGEVVRGTALGLLTGRTLEMLLLSFALADRFARTQRRLIEETEQRRLIEETYADELEIEVKERTRELAEANADKDRMLSVIGHDLRGPLTGLMRAADATPGPLAQEMSRTGRTLLLLIEDLVLWARLRAGRREPGVHAAGAITAPAAALHHALADQGGLALAAVVPPDLRVRTDLVLAQTLVRNLLANALKFARTRVELRAEAIPEGVRFTVGNDGPPLPPEVAARFAAGVDEPLSATGGLGLRLCREICRALGSRLEAGTAASGSTEFHFILPTVPVSPP